MSQTFATLFCKTARCPTSQVLLAYRQSFMNPNDRLCVEQHLASCDFCSAEVYFLGRHLLEPEEYTFAEMPRPLRRLAEDLLKGGTLPFRRSAELVEYPHVSH